LLLRQLLLLLQLKGSQRVFRCWRLLLLLL
jgi:hypothetical protein